MTTRRRWASSALYATLSVALLMTAGCSTGETHSEDGGRSPTSDGGTSRDDAAPTPFTDAGPPIDAGPVRSFCEAATWGGTAPGPESDLVVRADEVVTVDCDVEVHSLTIEAGGTVRASRTSSARLTLSGNLVVYGMLDYGSPSDRVRAPALAEIVFRGMDDEDYEGTPSIEPAESGSESVLTTMEVLDSDVGLWVLGDGVFRAAGEAKRAWSRLVDGAGPGDRAFTVENADGWIVGDRIALTTTATRDEDDFVDQFDEATIASIDGTTITLAEDVRFDHAGCTDCYRRGEAIDLTRNVVVRSADDTAHAHVMVAERAHVEIDSAELRWLGAERLVRCGGPQRRAPLYFHQQGAASTGSFVRHASIWGGQRSFLIVERSDGITIEDVAGYDAWGVGFALRYDETGCGTRCADRDIAAPHDVLFTDVLAARLGASAREEGCARIEHRLAAFDVGGSSGSGCLRCIAAGIGRESSGVDLAGFGWQESGTGRPAALTFRDCVAHDINGHGAFVWQNSVQAQPPYVDNAFWSTSGHAVHWGAYSNAYVLEGTLMTDNGLASLGIKAVPDDDRARIDGATVDDIRVLSYVSAQERANLLLDVHWTGERPVGVTQIVADCAGGNPEDPLDSACVRVWLRFERPVFPAGVVPFVFGDAANRHAVWEVRGFSSVDYPSLPADFDLYRRDNPVAGGSYFADFDAWLVPR